MKAPEPFPARHDRSPARSGAGALLLVLRLTLPLGLAGQDSSITYQGQLRQAGAPFTGTVDLEFMLFDAQIAGIPVGAPLSHSDWPVEDGLFQVELDFGIEAFTEQVQYLEVRVDGAPLSPRQAVRPSPMALFALAGNEGPAGPAGPQGDAGGSANFASGAFNAIGGGESNEVDGAWTTVPGGFGNRAAGDASFAAGFRARAVTNGSFVWSDISNPNSFVSTDLNQFLVRAAGGMGLGTNAPDSQLHINSGVGFNPLRVQVNGGTRLLVNANGGTAIGVNTTPPNAGLFVSGIVRMGSFGATGTTALCRNANFEIALCSSSARYKQDVEAFGPAAELIDALRPVRYRWIESGAADIGFIAEEVAELLPELITRNAHGEVEGLQYDRLTALLVAAMQQQQARTGSHEAELAELRDENARLRRTLVSDRTEFEARLSALEQRRSEPAQPEPAARE